MCILSCTRIFIFLCFRACCVCAILYADSLAYRIINDDDNCTFTKLILTLSHLLGQQRLEYSHDGIEYASGVVIIERFKASRHGVYLRTQQHVKLNLLFQNNLSNV